MDLDQMDDDQRREHFNALAHKAADRAAQPIIDALGGGVSAHTARMLHRIGFEFGHNACLTLAREIATRVTVASDARPTVIITRDQIECWAGRELTDDEVSTLDDCIPQSSIPDAVGDIVASFAKESAGEKS